MEKVIVHGSYFGRNFGDTLLIKTVVNWVKESGKFEPILVGVNSKEEALEIGARKVEENDWKDIKKVIYAGGGYFGEPNNRNFLRTLYWYFRNLNRHIFWLKKIKNPKIIVVGVGYGPVRYNFFKKAISKLFNKAEIVYIRDQESFDFYASDSKVGNHIEVGVDLAYYYGVNQNGDYPESDLIGIHIPTESEELSKKYVDILLPYLKDKKVEMFCDSIGQNNLSLNPNSFFYKLNKELNIPFIPYESIEKTFENLKRYKTVITSKLHIGIVATNLKIPVYSIPYHQKTIRYYRQIKQLERCNPIHNFDSEQHKKNMINILNLDKPVIPKIHYDKIKEIKENVNSFLND